MKRFGIIATVATAGLGALALGASANAADNAMQVCGAKYQAAKKANQLPAGQTWNQYLAQCRAGLKPATPAPAAAPKTAMAPKAATAAKPAGPKGAPTAAQQAMYDRERQCGKMWQADKAAHKTPAGQTWPQYWSACNKRLKG